MLTYKDIILNANLLTKLGQVFEIAYWYEVGFFIAAFLLVFVVTKNVLARVFGCFVLVSCLVCILINAVLLDADVCVDQKRIISDKEKLDAGIKWVIEDYEAIAKTQSNRILSVEKYKLYRGIPDYWDHSREFDRFDVAEFIPYIDTKEFIELNQDCCSIKTKITPEIGITFYKRVRLKYSRYIEIRYKMRFYDVNGKYMEVTQYWMRPVTQCAQLAPLYPIVD